MRPPVTGESKAFGTDLDGQGDEHPGVGVEGLDRRDRLLGVGAASRVVMDSRWTVPRLMLVPLAPLVATSRAAMDTGTRGPRIGGTGRLLAGCTSRTAGDLAVVVPHSRGSGRLPTCSPSRMAG
jgi:hypothetical protein